MLICSHCWPFKLDSILKANPNIFRTKALLIDSERAQFVQVCNIECHNQNRNFSFF